MVIKEMTAYGQNWHKDKKHDANQQHVISTGLFGIDLVIILPCYFSQPEQIVEEIIAPLSFLLLIFPFLHSKYIAWIMFDSAPLIQPVCY